MKCIGFSDEAIKWFYSYLTNITFFVSLDNDFSEAETIRVPQRSTLEPLLFLLYINDIPQALPDSDTYLYVDDTSIFYQYKDIAEIENVLNKEFENVCKWFVDILVKIKLISLFLVRNNTDRGLT